MDFLAENQETLSVYARISGEVGKNPAYVQGGGGNTSVKLGDGRMAIKASGYRLTDVTEKAGFAVLDYQAIRAFYDSHEPGPDAESAGNELAKQATQQIAGLEQVRPSVEAGFHSLLDTYVIHSHSVYANLAGCAVGGEELFERALEGADYSACVIPYADPGAGLTFLIRDALKDADGHLNVILMKNHGLVVTHSDAQRCMEIHEDVNRRLAAACGAEPFPAVRICELPDGAYASDTPYLAQCLTSGRFDKAFFLDDPLYPDQMVFLSGQFELTEEEQSVPEGKCAANPRTGRVVYRMRRENAQVIEETLTALVYIASHILQAGYKVSTMGDAAKAFIAGWESEKYRKSLAAKR